MSATKIANGDKFLVNGAHSQDFIHNGKKL